VFLKFTLFKLVVILIYLDSVSAFSIFTICCRVSACKEFLVKTDIANVIFQFLKFVLFECRSPDVERIDKSSIDCFAALNIFPICNPIDVRYENLNSDICKIH
jgi:hypothetical protein